MKNTFLKNKLTLSLFILISFSGFGQNAMRYMMQAKPFPKNEIPYGNNSKAGHYAKTKDAKIYYEVYGKGEPILILHGGVFGSTYEMAQVIDSLSLNYKVIAISTRGHGKSELGIEKPTLDLLANDVYSVITDALSPKDSVTVIGFSYGGYAAYKLASMHPERVKKMIVIGAAERHPGDMDLNVTPADGFKFDNAYWQQQLAMMPEPKRLDEMFASVKEFFNKRMIADKALFETIKCPVLVMAGYHDQFLKTPQVLNAAAMIPKGELAIIPNASHGIFIDQFSTFWAASKAFLNTKSQR